MVGEVVAVRLPFTTRIAISKEQPSVIIIAGLIIMITIRKSSALAVVAAAVITLLLLEVSTHNSIKIVTNN